MSIENILSDFNLQFENVKNKNQLEEIRVQFLGKKSALNDLFVTLKNLSAEEKKSFGAQINEARNLITQKIDEQKIIFENAELEQKLIAEKIDISEPVRSQNQGLIHPINKVMADIENIFNALGFEFAQGPEIEDDFHNFTALNMPKDHPARQMQDTFYLENSEFLLRTHTSNTQIRKMLNSKPPLRVCALGRVFRRDSDQTHTPMFHQFEGFVVDKSVHMGHLKATLENFLEQFFEVKNLELRFRPSFFPFTEPSAEVDINYGIENGKIKIGKGDKFMEILGCGMIHRNVLSNCNINPDEFQGFAFGIGIERLTMLKYGITDLRMLFENDIRFLKHYGFKANDF
ncbi:MAG: phenylalanine--tRNA ligase subunit alpha [Rickettsiales bacterium]